MQSPSPLPEKKNTPFCQPMEWQKYSREGSQFLALARQGVNRRDKFNAEALYNVLAMAVEKKLMALFLYKNYLPEGHTLNDMLSAAASFIDIDMKLIKGINFMESFQDICSVDEFTKKEPTAEELEQMVDTASLVAACVAKMLPA